jgi:bacterioferritin
MQANRQLIDGLNEDLAAEWGTIMRYTFQSAKALGLRGAELREILQREIPDELGHARYLTDIISDMGGEPTMKPHDWDRITELKPMLEMDLKMELGDVENYTKHSRMAEDLGLTELKVKLEEMASDESRHAREIERILKGL